jgi:hypothetical protein
MVIADCDTNPRKRGFVNPPVVRGSIVLYPTADDLRIIVASYSMADTAR